MTAYSTLVGDKTTDGSIKSWVNDSTIPSTVILTSAEAWIYTRLRVGQMLSIDSGTIAAAATTLALPSDYLNAVHFEIVTPNQRVLHSIEPERMQAKITYTTAGVRESAPPNYYTRIGTNFHFDFASDQAYTTSLLYYAQPAALSGSNETNFLTDRYPQVLYWACQAFAYDFKKDEQRRNDAFALAEGEIRHVNGDWDRERQESYGGIYQLG